MPAHHDISPERPVILTGDRTTGPLHLGHYVGSLPGLSHLGFAEGSCRVPGWWMWVVPLEGIWCDG